MITRSSSLVLKSNLAWPLLVFLLAATVLVYWPGLYGGFIFDDLPNLVLSSAWKINSFTPGELRQALQSDISGSLGRPLAMLSFAANHVWTGSDPFALKLTNLAMHLVNGLLVFLFCRQLVPLAGGSGLTPGRSSLAAALVAGAWLLHPLQVSTVLYTVQRMEIGAATGVLACINAYLLARTHWLQGRPCLPWFGLAAVALLLGLGFKESSLVALPLLLGIELFVLGFRDGAGRVSRRILAMHGLWFVPALLGYGLVVVPGAFEATAYAHRDFDLSQRLLSQGPVLAMYLGQVIMPLPESLVFYYDHLRAPEGVFNPPWTAVSLLGLFGLAVLAWGSRRRWPLASLGIFWFFACHALTSNVIPLELAFEHRNYLALLGPLFVACELIAWCTRRLHDDAALCIGVVPVLALAFLCLLQTSTWGDSFRLATSLASRNPESPRANYHLGTQLHHAAHGDTESPQWSMALRQFEAAASLPGSSALPDQALLIMESTDGSSFPRARWQALESKLLKAKHGPEDVGALHSVVACRLENRCNIPDTAVLGLLRRMQDKHPDDYLLAIIRANFLWNAVGDQDAAIGILRDWRARGNSPYQIDVALAELLMASNLHAYNEETISLIEELGSRNLPPEARETVRILQARLEIVRGEPEPQ